jgi:FkbM family methyltransferase
MAKITRNLSQARRANSYTQTLDWGETNGIASFRKRKQKISSVKTKKPAEITVTLYDPIDQQHSWPLIGSSEDEGILGALEKSEGMYEVRLVKALSRLLGQDGVVLDIGANIGTLTLPLSARCPSGVVYAFEPVSLNRRFLERNTSSIPNIRVCHFGLGSSNGQRTIHIDPHHPGGAHTGGNAEEEEFSEMIEIVTLDSWVSANKIDRIDMIKLDIEGGELDFLDGAAETLKKFKPVLAVECNPIPLWRFAHAGPSALIERLVSFYNDVGWIDEDGTIRRLESTDQALSKIAQNALIDLICGAPFSAEASQPSGPARETKEKPTPRKPFFRRWAHRGIRAIAKALVDEFEAISRDPSQKKPAPNPEFTYIHSPAYKAVFDVNRLQVTPGSFFRLPVRFRNTSRFWYWSHWPNPVTATYRWRRGKEIVVKDGIRTLLHDPIAPGTQATISLSVVAPEEPGDYELAFCLVQEGYAWFDQLKPELGVSLPVAVR